MNRFAALCLIFICGLFPAHATTTTVSTASPIALISNETATRNGKSGIHVLETGTEALLTRAWLVDHAQHSIEVQYFIWSTDNIGILAAEALLRAAERGVKVRVIVDDLLIDAPDKSLLALAMHPNIDIRIYNPKSSVGVTMQKRILNAVSDFRGINQRMHNKTFIVDGKIGITGGRNMATEYYDYNHNYNFRDRDVLLFGDVVKSMQASFEQFWSNQLSVSVEDLYQGFGIMQKNVRANEAEARQVYQELRQYAQLEENFSPSVRAAIHAAPNDFRNLVKQVIWDKVEFVSDLPGKNDNRFSLGGGGAITTALARMVDEARSSIVIQSPYLILSDDALKLFKRAIKRGVKVRINTNSLASTDNLPAYSGYRNQRDKLLKLGIEIFEFKPNPASQQRLMNRFAATESKEVIFGLHAKSMVVDGHTTYIGTFNLDPRSENLNTEAGVIIRNETLARQVESAIEADMHPDSSWHAATTDSEKDVPLAKRSKVKMWQVLPLKPIL